MADSLIDYRWLVVTIVALLAVVVVQHVIDRERALHLEVVAAEQRFRSISRVLPVGVFQAAVPATPTLTAPTASLAVHAPIQIAGSTDPNAPAPAPKMP